MSRTPWAAAAILVLGANACAAAAPSSWDRAGAPPDSVAKHVTLEVFVKKGKLKYPVCLTFAPGDPARRLFAVEREGRIRIIRNGVLEAKPFLDIEKRVESGFNERGLLSVAFHPRFKDNGKLYVNFTDLKGDTRVVEFAVLGTDPDSVDLASERELLFVDQPYANHNGGNLVFGPDELLYIGMGDGGSAGDPKGNGQNPTALLGKMLRIDVNAAKPRPEIIGRGLRNPWRYSFDRKTGDLYIADVGQNEYEEIHVVAANDVTGHNFGWSPMEGMHCYRSGCDPSKYTAPVMEYSHDVGCSITGGYVYRGRALPELDGAYFYADYCTAVVRSFRWKDGGATDSWEWRPVLDPGDSLASIGSFGEDADGELYVISHDGIIYRIVRKKA